MWQPTTHHMGIMRPTNSSAQGICCVVWRHLTFVPPTKIPPRAPFGPSLVFAAGMPFSAMAVVLQKSAAVSKEICRH